MGMIDKQMTPPIDDESAEDPKEEATESPAEERTEDAQEPDEQGAAPADESAETNDPDSGGELTITPEKVMAGLHLQPGQAPQLQRIVIAGMKVMFDPKTHQLMQKAMAGPEDLPTKLGKGVAGLMGLLMKESQNSLPPKLLVPAGTVLLAHAADYLDQTGTPVSDNDFADALHIFVAVVLHVNGVDADKVAAMGAKAGQQPPADPAAPPPADPAAPPDAPAGPPQGLVGGAMQ